jgi:hypothetical protein
MLGLQREPDALPVHPVAGGVAPVEYPVVVVAATDDQLGKRFDVTPDTCLSLVDGQVGRCSLTTSARMPMPSAMTRSLSVAYPNIRPPLPGEEMRYRATP